MKGTPISYTDQELAFIKKRKAQPRRELHAKFVAKFGRTDVSLDNFKSLCKRKGWFTGRTGHFKKGHVPANTGMKMPFHPTLARTQFKKGQKPHNTKPAGHERVNVQGYVEININETNPYSGASRRYVHKHRHLWEQKYGPVPKGKVLKCLDGDKTNTDPSNWKLMDRGMLPRLNGVRGRDYDNAPAVLKPTIMAVVELEHSAHEKTKG